MQLRLLFGLLALVGVVLGSSLLGLTRPMVDDPVEGGWELFGDVWQANFWGDLMFTAGTLGAAIVVAFLVREAYARQGNARWTWLALAVGGGLLLHWTVYAISWSLTLNPYVDANWAQEEPAKNFWGWDWDMMYAEPLIGLESAWTFTWCWGWAGLIYTALAVPVISWLVLWRQGAIRPDGALAKPTKISPGRKSGP